MNRKAPRRSRLSFPVVGIGASAGGLEALTRLLSSLPADTGMAFVIIQHLDPKHESLLPVILQKATKMPVVQAVNGSLIAPNHVYVIPPGTHMCLEGGRLRLIPRPAAAPATSVNCFLSSLARERGNSGIAVILSGTASDGAQGVKAVKSEGGVVFAQDQASAVHGGMPRSAAATGAVDYILPPEAIAAELKRMSRHRILGPDVSGIFADSDSLGRIFGSLQRATGVDFSLYKPSTIQRRVLRRLLLHKLDDLAPYARLLEKTPGESQSLHDDLLIHVTHFFREPAQHDVLRAKVFPRLLKSLPDGRPLRIWVPGCASGEEAYSIAITLLDHLAERDLNVPVQIFATDVSETALEKAREGLYPEEAASQVPARLLRRFFTKEDSGYRIAKRVRDLCVFARHDLIKDPPFANLDLISCCNVLIYLSAQAQAQVLPMFHYALRASGALLLSKAETVGSFASLFSAADRRCRLYLKKSAPGQSRTLRAMPRQAVSQRDPTLGRKSAVSPETDMQKAAERLLLARFAPAGVIVNGDLSILHFRGHVNRFLEPSGGRASLSLPRMLPAHAAAVVKALVQKARKSEASAHAAGVTIGGDGSPARSVTIEVIPFRLPVSGERFFIVLFEEEAARKTRDRVKERAPERATASARRLKAELTSARDYLQTVVEESEAASEELKSANEEIVSSNEELQSTNEELEIAKEELQAANEELTTLNDELQSRNAELGGLNNDLTNLLASVHLPIVMVSTDLRIRRFTPAAERIMNLIPTDAGRPIGDLVPRVPLPNIEEIIHDVIETVAPKEVETSDAQGRAYLIRVRPYKTVDNKIEGAVIVFLESSSIRRGSALAEEGSAFEAALDLVDDPLALLDAQLRVKAVSRSMYKAFGLTESQLGVPLFAIENGRWNLPELRSGLERVASEGVPLRGLKARVGAGELAFDARRVLGAGDGSPMVLLAIHRL